MFLCVSMFVHTQLLSTCSILLTHTNTKICMHTFVLTCTNTHAYTQPASHHPMPHSASVQVFSTTLTSPPPSRTHSSSLKQHDGCDGSEDSSARSSRGELEQRTSPAAHVSLAIPIMSALQQRRQTMSALPSSALPDIIESDTQQPQEGVTPLLRPSFCTLPAAHPSTLPFSSSPPKFLRV